MTRSEENYLKAIFHLGGGNATSISTNAIAEQMETKPSSVTDMAKKLSEKGLVNYKKYQGVSLTDEGKKESRRIVRLHRLWEQYLLKRTSIASDHVHAGAEAIEHILSPELERELELELGIEGIPKEDY